MYLTDFLFSVSLTKTLNPWSQGCLIYSLMTKVSYTVIVVVVKSLSHVWLFVTPWTAASQASLFSTISRSLLRFIATELVMLSNHLIFCHPLLPLPSIFPGSFPMSQVNKCRGFQSNKGSVLGSQWQCLELGPVLYNGLVQNTAV